MNLPSMFPTLHESPRRRDVLIEQIRAVALVLRIPAILAAAGIGFTTALNVWDFIKGRGGVEFAPELSMLPGTVGALLPLGIWKREERVGGGFFWALPVDRRQHALIKVCAGWACLMMTVGFFMVWLLVLAAVTGGNILGSQQLLLLPANGIPASGALAPTDLLTVSWTPMPALWLAPFTASTGTYLLASAFALGARYPLRWMIGLVLGALLLSLTGTVTHVEWLKFAPSRMVELVHTSTYGLDALMTAKTESLKTAITLADGKTVSVWRALPDLKEWILASLLWFAIGLTALWVAASRHREQRSSSHSNSTD
jgi:hypothetical protein